jgi:predicted transcriptional regulator
MAKPEISILQDIFLRDKPSKILLGMKTARESVYATILSKEADCTYSHTIKILNMFRKLGIVRFEKKGRIKRVMLTDDGWDIAHNLEAMIKKFGQIEAKAPAEEEKKEEKKKARRKK